MEKSRILVTGGAGYIGSHTLVEALREGHEVLVVDNFCNSSEDVLRNVQRITNKDIGLEVCDIRDAERLIEIFEAFRPDAVIHFAGLKAVGESSENPSLYYASNVTGSINVIRAMEACDCRQIVFSSSATVYGEPAYLPIDEDHPLRTTNPYGRSKLQVEDILRDQAAARPDWSVAILRYFNPVGAHESGLIGETPQGRPNNLMPFVSQVASGHRDELAVFGDDYDTIDGTGVRDYIHVVDLARAHVSALRWTARSTGARAFNLGVGQGSSVLEMIEMFQQVSGRRVAFRVGPRRSGDVAEVYADPRRAAQELDWAAQRGLEEMCESAWAWEARTRAEKSPA